MVFAQNNSLTSIKLTHLPEDKLRFDFQFVKPLQQPPSSFLTPKPTRLVLDFIDSSLKLPAGQKAKQIKLGSLKTYNIVTMGTRVRAILDLEQLVTYSETINGSVYTLILNGKERELLELTRTKGVKLNLIHAKPQVDYLAFRDVDLAAQKMQRGLGKKNVFTGKHISLNFQNISIRAVLQLIAEFTHINIVVSDKVQGNITLQLHDIPWDQALDIILTTQGLDKRQTGNVILIDTKASLDIMEEQQLKSQQVIQKLEPIHSELLQVNYAKAVDIAMLIKDRQNSLLSEQGKISVDIRTNTIWVQDSNTKVEEVKKLVKQLDVPVKQVLIEARIVEVTKDFARDLGIRWGISKPKQLSGTLVGANQMQQGTSPANVNPYTQRLNLDLVAAPIAGMTPASVGIALAKLGDNILLDLELSALESEGRAELISSPRLITTNQQPATIDSGQEIPYQESTSSGATAVAFKKAVLSLRVTPQITPDSKILMDLKINQDTTSTQLFNGVPAILTKEIQTNVLVSNGQTIVLGGIYQQDKSRTINRIPFLGQLPVVGNLFKNTQISLTNDELLIFITPKIITNSLSITTVKERERNRVGMLKKPGKPIILGYK